MTENVVENKSNSSIKEIRASQTSSDTLRSLIPIVHWQEKDGIRRKTSNSFPVRYNSIRTDPLIHSEGCFTSL